MSFSILFVIVLCGLVGPLLAGVKRLSVPLVVGEILAGIIVGKSGLDLLNVADPTLVFLSTVGFALLMFLVGTHLPLRDPNLKKALRTGLVATVLSFVLAVPAGLLLAHLTGISAPIFVLILANSSAAVMMPIIHERHLDGQTVLLTSTWVAIADAVTIIALPMAMSTGNTITVTIGGALVLVTALVVFFGLGKLRETELMQYYRALSKARGWALDLRVSLAFLLGLCWMATSFGTSDLVAGFAAGAVVSLWGEPKRLVKQLIGIGEGFFVPLFFVVLGAKLDFGALLHSPSNLMLTALIVAASVVVHVLVARIVRLPFYSGLAAAAQLGLPAAVVSLGLANHMLDSGQAAAIIVAALISLVSTTVGMNLLTKNAANEKPAP
ncbi:MAG: cation:proton antiporter [Cyanobacteria bacterium SZAS LIN-2]|nr:cation:proton antiporter [Cyanobacteria bacterium SZAS LIN-2]